MNQLKPRRQQHLSVIGNKHAPYINQNNSNMKTYLFLIALLFNMTVYATDFRAGEITYKHVSGLTYEFKINIYTDSSSSAADSLTLYFGDGTSVITSDSGFHYILDSTIICRSFIGTHTYAGTGFYSIHCECPNRNAGITNIPNSADVPLYLESQININAFLGPANSSDFLNPGYDIGIINNIYTYNSCAVDIDGDSISYELMHCLGAGGAPIPGYSYPQASNSFSLDSLTGDVIWDYPSSNGYYNIAIKIKEWRQSIFIGFVERDIQIKITNSNSTNEINTKQNDVSVYPNPTNEILFIKQNLSSNIFSTFDLFDINGKLYLTGHLDKEQSIHLGQLAKGFYSLRLTNDTETLTRKIIKE